MAKCLLALCAALLLAACVNGEEEKFLIQFAEGADGVWMTEEEVIGLAVKDIGFMDITDDLPGPLHAPPTPPPLPNQPQQKQYARSLIKNLDTSRMLQYDQTLSDFPTRYYTSETGKQAAEYIHSTLQALKVGRDDIEVEYFENTWLQPSVIARFNGNVKKDEIVILGAHEDSVSPSMNAPGADDDGSGSSTNLEIFGVLASSGFKPNRTVEFHWYSAEEAGLKGSAVIAQKYYNESKDVVSMLQLDMTYWAGSKGENVVGIVTDFVDGNLTQFIRQCVEAYSDIPWENTLCGYACSDHASWEKYGYRSAFPFETPFGDRNPYIHTRDDTTEHVDINHGLEFAKFALGYVVEMAATEYMS